MESTLNYNFNLFYSDEFLNTVWNELTFNLEISVNKFKEQEKIKTYIESYPTVYFPEYSH